MAREFTSVREADVLVVGGGTAGAIAAIAAGRKGCKTILIEESDILGGTLVGQQLQHISTFHDTDGNLIVGGIPQEIIDRLMELGGSPGHVPDTTGYSYSVTPVDHELLLFVLEEFLEKAHVEVLLNTHFSDTIVEDGVVRGCVAENSRSGAFAVYAKTTVDCTGDALVAFRAGAECRSEGASEQAMSVMFTMANVDCDQLLDYIEQNPGDFRDTSTTGPGLRELPAVSVWGFGSLLKKGAEEGLAPILRNEMHVSVWPPKKLAIMNVTRVAGDPLDDASRSKAISQLRKQAVAFSRFLIQDVPGFQNAYLSKVGRGAFAHRASRSIVGEYTLTEADFRQGRAFEDGIAQSCFPSDRHDTKGASMLVVESSGTLDISVRCMIPQKIDGLIVAGRCVSAEKVVTASIRMTAPCMAMGQAAGTAAALAAESGVAIRALDVKLLKSELASNGVLFRNN